MKDAQAEREVKERQIEDLTSLVEETRQSLQGEYEAKVSINLFALCAVHFWHGF